MVLPVLLGYLILFCLTAVYCVILWFGSSIWATHFLQGGGDQLPLISKYTIAPLPLPPLWNMIHWQGIAAFSFFLCFIWGIARNRKLGQSQGHALPMTVHLSWLFFAFFCHILGILFPMVSLHL